jgi:hypothetical protein
MCGAYSLKKLSTLRTSNSYMKQLVLFLMLAAFALPYHRAWGGELVLTGVYHGSNLYVQNPGDAKTGYCVQSVLVNGRKVMDASQASVFTIDLSTLETNTPLRVEIHHKDGCEPKVINPNAIRIKEEFQFVFLDVDDHILHWQAKGDKKMSKYFIEKFEHNNWAVEKAIDSRGVAGTAEYKEPVEHHTGVNRYRIKYVESSGKSYYSEEVRHESVSESVTFFPKKVSNLLSFSREIDYEIRDAYGNKVLTGHAKDVDCTALKTGLYYISFDNRTEKFFKK